MPVREQPHRSHYVALPVFPDESRGVKLDPIGRNQKS